MFKKVFNLKKNGRMTFKFDEFFFLDKSAHDIRIAIKLWKAELEFV